MMRVVDKTDGTRNKGRPAGGAGGDNHSSSSGVQQCPAVSGNAPLTTSQQLGKYVRQWGWIVASFTTPLILTTSVMTARYSRMGQTCVKWAPKRSNFNVGLLKISFVSGQIYTDNY